ncbi:MAG TPA: EI24 domain-containing protein [Candidatus Stackebrandtia faecavium]|nr:EI24 domain-containing protein [Candidatus Stackebrandtia faecavium]
MRDFALGLQYFRRGFALWSRQPKLMLLGAIPAVISTLILGALLVVLAFNLPGLTSLVTGFADSWGSQWQTVLQVVAGIIIMALGLWLAVVVFVGLTLLIGDPFYEAISERVEAEFGAVPEDPRGFWASMFDSIKDSLRLLAKSIGVGLVLFFVGFIPFVGTVASMAVGAIVGGWFLAIELSSHAHGRRGIRYQQYRQMLRKRRMVALGLGVPVFLLFLIPITAIVVMPAAVAGGTLLARDAMGERVD